MQHIQENTEQHIEQHIQDNTETEHTIQNTQNTAHAQPQRTEHSTYDLQQYSFDLYHEQIYIKNSNTIELYTILKD